MASDRAALKAEVLRRCGSWHAPIPKLLSVRPAQECDVLLEMTYEIESGLSVELVAERARDGLRLVEELTGRIDTEEVLGIIFNSFCIGK